MSAPAVPAIGTAADLSRITVQAETGRADFAVPAVLTIGDLVPMLVARTRSPEQPGGYVLQRLGDPPLPLESTVQALDVRDGEVLYLRPAPDPLPVLDFDDVADGVATAISAQGDRWRPELTGRLLLGLAGLLLAILAAAMLGMSGTGEAWHAGLGCGIVAVVLGVGCVLVTRLAHHVGAGLLTGLGSCAFGVLGALIAARGIDGLIGPDRNDLLRAGLTLVVLSGGVLAAAVVPVPVFATSGSLGLVAVLGPLLSFGFDWTPTTTMAVLATAMFVLGGLGPRLATRFARLKIPQLPRNSAELQTDIEPEEGTSLTRRATAADGYLGTLTITASVVYAAAFWYLVMLDEWIGWVLAAVLAIAVLLRSRAQTGAWQRIPLAIAGTIGVASVCMSFAMGGTAGDWLLLGCLLIGVASLLVVAAIRLPVTRMKPVWGHIADLAETWSAVALVPLLFQVLHVYAWFRALAG